MQGGGGGYLHGVGGDSGGGGGKSNNSGGKLHIICRLGRKKWAKILLKSLSRGLWRKVTESPEV